MIAIELSKLQVLTFNFCRICFSITHEVIFCCNGILIFCCNGIWTNDSQPLLAFGILQTNKAILRQPQLKIKLLRCMN